MCFVMHMLEEEAFIEPAQLAGVWEARGMSRRRMEEQGRLN